LATINFSGFTHGVFDGGGSFYFSSEAGYQAGVSDLPADLDLRLLPDWLKETSTRRYDDYDGEESSQKNFDRGGPREKAPRRERQTKSKHVPDRGQEDRRDVAKQRPDPRPGQPTFLAVDFLADEPCATKIAAEIKTTGHAYPLFQLARMFLDRPERHRVKIASTDVAHPLFACGELISLEKAHVERNAFDALKSEYYEEQSIEREPIQGNFGNIARCRLSGVLLGPTNHHSYQPFLRRLYEERFSRRMTFPEYLREIQVVNDPALIEEWKESARKGTVYKTLREVEALTFESAGAAADHFHSHYLEANLRSGAEFEISGEKSRALLDRSIAAALREAWERERAFPSQMMNHLRRHFLREHMHVFRHHKRMLFVSAIRPRRFEETDVAISDRVGWILRTIAEASGCTRQDLARKFIESQTGDATELKSGLAADLHWLRQSGHVIEFLNGRLDVPLDPNVASGPQKNQPNPEAKAGEPAPDAP
jgi:hypothetical protein